ncbi:MAG: hypothetical protein JWO30_3078 [Fibrobacteres bacterium]|nr:hypothetical protein [Fibrobacterota bacterium]
MFGGIGPMEILLVVFMLGAFAIPAVFYLLTISKLLSACDVRNRTLEPGKVWFTLIPIFGLYWQFVVVLSVSKSLQNELRFRGEQSDEEPGKNVGLAMCILFSLGAIPAVNMVVAIPGFICWIVYWVKMANMKEKLLFARSENGVAV